MFSVWTAAAWAGSFSTVPDWEVFESDVGMGALGNDSVLADTNGDGYDDIVVTSSDGAGFHVVVWFGSPTGPAALFDAVVDVTLGPWVSQNLTAGDFDGDGFDDVVVTDGVSLQVFPGSPTGPVQAPLSLDTPSGSVYTFAGIGDTDGDGYDELAVTDRTAALAGQWSGAVWIWAGGASGLGAQPNLTLGAAADEYCGGALAGVDTNGDGLRDLAVTCGEYPLFFGSPEADGIARVYLGSPAGLPTAPDWQFAYGYYGCFEVGGGDVHGDGYDDVVVADHCAEVAGTSFAGEAWLYAGGPAGPGAAAVWSMTGQDYLDHFGAGIAVGDIDTDGDGDLVIGASRRSNPETDEGTAYLFEGDPTGPATVSTWSWEPDETYAYFGGSLRVGDVDGDGAADLAEGYGNTTMVFFYGPFPDADGDGFVEDCDDRDPDVHPDAVEVAGNGVDENCDGLDADDGIAAFGPDDLVLTEVMLRPMPGQPVWFELLNRSALTVDLTGLVLSWDTAFVELGSMVLEPDTRLVVAADAGELPGTVLVVPELAFVPDTTIEVTGMEPLDQRSFVALPNAQGASTQLSPALEDDREPGSSWCTSTVPYGTASELGTPGAPNEDCAVDPGPTTEPPVTTPPTAGDDDDDDEEPAVQAPPVTDEKGCGCNGGASGAGSLVGLALAVLAFRRRGR